jgi:hypothetical protein
VLIDCFNGRTCAKLDIAALIKIMGEPSVVITGLWFDICVVFPLLLLEKYKIASWKKKRFEDLDDMLVSLRLYYINAEDSSSIFTM